MEATPSDWAAMLGGSRASPNYSRLVTSRGRRWRSSRAGTINQRRLACSQGDWREVFKAGAGARAESIAVGEAAGEEQHMPPPAHKQDVHGGHAFVSDM